MMAAFFIDKTSWAGQAKARWPSASLPDWAYRIHQVWLSS